MNTIEPGREVDETYTMGFSRNTDSIPATPFFTGTKAAINKIISRNTVSFTVEERAVRSLDHARAVNDLWNWHAAAVAKAVLGVLDEVEDLINEFGDQPKVVGDSLGEMFHGYRNRYQGGKE